MRTSKTLAVGTAILMLVAVGVKGEDGTDKKQGKSEKNGRFEKLGELKAYREKQKKSREEYRKQRMEENKAFHESLKDKEPLDVLNAVIAHRKSQYSETKTFMDGLYNDFVSYAKEIMAKKEVPAEKQSQFLSKLGEHHSEAVKKHEEMHNNLISALEELKNKENLTKEDIKKTLSEILPGRNRKPGKRKGKRTKTSDNDEE